ncbi:MAG: ATP-binding protein [bacterium]|nr:ATP-binding protein [bacterium]
MENLIVPILYIVVAVNVILAFVIFSRGLKNLKNLLFALIALTTAIWSVAIIGFFSPEYRSFFEWIRLTHISALLIAFVFFHFSLVFPQKVYRSSLIAYLFSIPCLVALYFLFFTNLIVSNSGTGVAYGIEGGYIFYGLLLTFYFFSGYFFLDVQYKRAKTEEQKGQVKYVFIGSLLTSALAIVPDLIFPFFKIFDYTWLGPIFTLFLVVSIFIAMVRFQLFNIRIILTELFTGVIIIVMMIDLFLSSSTFDLLVKSGILVLITFFGFLLIKSVYREVEQREHIEKLAGELEEANRRQESLLHFIGHEIKGYFTKSHWALSSMIDGDYGEIAPDLKMLTTQALDDTRQGIDMVDGILKAGNFKKGTVSFNMKPFDFKGELNNVIGMLKPNIETKKLALQLNIDENQDYTLNGDGEQISKHVLRNLIDNAIKYTPSGTITISLSKKDSKILFSVKDSGVGIKEEDRKLLFTEGGRGKDSVKINVHSTGYGLFIAKQIVDAHKGRIWADSTGPNQGSTFSIEI